MAQLISRYKHSKGESVSAMRNDASHSCSAGMSSIKSGDYSYVVIRTNGVDYSFPLEFGKSKVCNLCIHQLDCLSGGITKIFEEAT